MISWVIGCWALPCIACCPVDKRARYVPGAQQTTIFQTTTGAHPTKTETMSRQASAAPSSMTITVPEGAAAGQTLTVQAPTGQTLSVQVPPGAAPGSQFVVSMPAPAPVVQAVAAQHVAQPVANAV